MTVMTAITQEGIQYGKYFSLGFALDAGYDADY